MASASLRQASERERAGALWMVAERFAAQARLPSAERSNTNERLRALYRAIERFLDLDHISAGAEHEFVEGAGAMLGVLLVQHFVDARHACHEGKHRVQLGAHGFFDPFAAIERTLSSDEPRKALSDALALAEAERRSEGPVSRVVRGLSRRLSVERPELRLVEHFDLSVSLSHPDLPEPFALDLSRAVSSTRDQSDAAVERVVSRLVSMLPGAATPALDLVAEKHRILPRLARRAQMRELSAQASAPLFCHALTEELGVALQLEVDGRNRYLRESETARAGLDVASAIGLALENLAARSARFRLVREDLPEGALFVARSGDGLDSARVLLPELHALLLARIGGPVLVSVPHRDSFFACAAGNAPLTKALHERTAYDAARAPHALSATVYEFTSPGDLRALPVL